jgi:integrase
VAVRQIVFPKFLAARLEAHLAERVGADPSALVFTLPSGVPLRYSRFRRRYWDPAVAAAKLDAPLGLHALRHTFASLAAKAGASVKMVQTQLGHSDPALTLRVYQHLFDDDLDALASRLDLNFGAEANGVSDVVRPDDGLGLDDTGSSPVGRAATSSFEAPSA